MENKIELKCAHLPKKHRLVFSCKVTGSYELVVCEKCYQIEDLAFLEGEKIIGEDDK